MSPYNEIAGMYDEFWADWYLPAAMPALERLFFTQVPAGAHVLDVCCGAAHVTRELVMRGYEVTGVDNSAALIAIARSVLPETDLLVQDVRCLQLDQCYDAALSTFDSLNHLLSMEDLEQALASVHRALKPNARFVFDMNTEKAYSLDMQRWTVEFRDFSVGLVRGLFNPVTQHAHTELIWFSQAGPGGLWRRHESVVEQRCYAKEEVF